MGFGSPRSGAPIRSGVVAGEQPELHSYSGIAVDRDADREVRVAVRVIGVVERTTVTCVTAEIAEIGRIPIPFGQ